MMTMVGMGHAVAEAEPMTVRGTTPTTIVAAPGQAVAEAELMTARPTTSTTTGPVHSLLGAPGPTMGTCKSLGGLRAARLDDARRFGGSSD